jgi:hypothetical protein
MTATLARQVRAGKGTAIRWDFQGSGNAIRGLSTHWQPLLPMRECSSRGKDRTSAHGCKSKLCSDLAVMGPDLPLIFVHLHGQRSNQVLTSFLRSMALAAALAVSSGVVSATTVSLVYEGGTSDGSVKFVATPFAAVTGSSAGAFGFNMNDVTQPESLLGKFVAWCLDIEHFLGKKGQANTYTITENPFSNSFGLDAIQRGRVQAVFDANYSGLNMSDKAQAAGFQVALWNALYDTDDLAAEGVFAVAATAGILNKANEYLAKAKAFDGAKVWNMTFLESTPKYAKDTRQNLVTVAPVPVPAAAGLMLLALGGLAAVGRRRKI